MGDVTVPWPGGPDQQPATGAVSGETIARLVEGRYADPDGGGLLRVPTRAVVIADSLVGDEAELIDRLGLGRAFAVVSDAVTHAVLGARVERALGTIPLDLQVGHSGLEPFCHRVESLSKRANLVE